MLIYVNKKKMFFIGRTDGPSTQNYSSEPHKIYFGKIKSNLKKAPVKYIKNSILNTTQKNFFKNITLLTDMFQISFKFLL